MHPIAASTRSRDFPLLRQTPGQSPGGPSPDIVSSASNPIDVSTGIGLVLIGYAYTAFNYFESAGFVGLKLFSAIMLFRLSELPSSCFSPRFCSISSPQATT